MQVAIVKYNAGNICSVLNALKRLGVDPLLTDDAEKLMKADRVLFPGQGEASNAMRYLKEHGLDKVIVNLKQPLLGICIGQQLLCKHSEEGDVDCLGVFDTDVRRFCPTMHEQKVPHMGWNTLQTYKNEDENENIIIQPSPILKEISDNDFVYFVHSYYVPLCKDTIAGCNYIHPFSAALQKENFYATQFHPEKSGTVGERIIKNFLEIED